MNRRSIIRVLLSLLLLVSQQMATMHAMSHWSGTRDGTEQLDQPDDADLSSAVAQDQSCHQCLAFAQLASPVGSSQRAFDPGHAGSSAVESSVPAAPCARTVCVFEPRAPPQA